MRLRGAGAGGGVVIYAAMPCKEKKPPRLSLFFFKSRLHIQVINSGNKWQEYSVHDVLSFSKDGRVHFGFFFAFS